jgi:hypothetical protein
LLLLVWVLSVQTSWAAVHFCDESARANQASASHQHANLFPVHDEHTGTGGDAAADACCSVAHGYHGLQALITQALPQLPLLALAATPAEAPPRGARERFPERHERPQWPAA